MKHLEIKEDFVQTLLLYGLLKYWKIVRLATLNGRGVDIKAKHNNYGRYYLIEARLKDNLAQKLPLCIR